MILLKNITKQYGTFKAVDNLNIEISEGNIIGLIGPNGSGKTTTINMIVGLSEPSKGTIEIFGEKINENPILIKKNLGYVSDESHRFLKLKGIEYLNFIADIYKIPTDKRQKSILELSEIFEMTNHLDKRIEKYSKGMKQKITIISSLLHNPKLWILDEPFNGLDPTSCYTLKKFMKEYAKQGNIVLVSSHILEIMENLCDELILIKYGKTIYHGNIETLKKNFKEDKSLEEIYMEVLDNEGIFELG
ncbi:ABC transporter ATP-binding protein [Clostridium mediterraneense]|uniref:ABC transporter ATP-binding protein n=1 Tax=Clostridium mediterraneense TaxID=1805472 RepID=UPI0008312ED5|nr:ABC transporter ATP-binding protein [Clostridium mediterraneense]